MVRAEAGGGSGETMESRWSQSIARTWKVGMVASEGEGF